jgi:mono/diheme cytochrome c family protein
MSFTLQRFTCRFFFRLAVLVPGSVHASVASPVTYEQLQPVLQERCVICHTGDMAPLSLRLDSYEALLKGSQNGPVVKAGDSSSSELILRLKGTKQPRMPMTGPPFLSDEQVGLFEQWIDAGMPPADTVQGKTKAPQMAAVKPTAESLETVTYAHVAPLFAQRCAKCHTERGLMGPAPEGYRLTSYDTTLSALDRVRVIPGQPRASELVRRIRGWSLPRMPFDGPPFLSEDEIQLIEKWIAQGARDASGKPAAVPAGAEVRLQGVLDGRWQLDGLPLQIGPWTRIKKSPSAGDFVEVRGVVLGDGGIRVLRLRRR